MGQQIKQKTINEHFCLTDLAIAYEKVRAKEGWPEKQISKFFDNKEDVIYIVQLLELQGVLIESNKLLFMETVKSQGLLKALKSIGQYQITGRGANRFTYCNPYVFVAIAQWLNPILRAYVTFWVTDELVLNRIEAGAGFNRLTKAITDKIVPTLSDNGKKFIYSNFAKLLNVKVFGKHDNELRQIASKDQLSELRDLEVKLSTLVEVGYIKSYAEAKEYLNK